MCSEEIKARTAFLDHGNVVVHARRQQDKAFSASVWPVGQVWYQYRSLAAADGEPSTRVR